MVYADFNQTKCLNRQLSHHPRCPCLEVTQSVKRCSEHIQAPISITAFKWCASYYSSVFLVAGLNGRKQVKLVEDSFSGMNLLGWSTGNMFPHCLNMQGQTRKFCYDLSMPQHQGQDFLPAGLPWQWRALSVDTVSPQRDSTLLSSQEIVCGIQGF